jgi:plasmid stability protein
MGFTPAEPVTPAVTIYLDRAESYRTLDTRLGALISSKYGKSAKLKCFYILDQGYDCVPFGGAKMAITITLPDEIEIQLQRKAQGQHLSVEELALEILGHALETEEPFPTPEEVVAKIQATPPNPHNIRPAGGSLAGALRNAPDDPDFDLVAWNREWAAGFPNFNTRTG